MLTWVGLAAAWSCFPWWLEWSVDAFCRTQQLFHASSMTDQYKVRLAVHRHVAVVFVDKGIMVMVVC
jgi:hypothetical protein